MSPTPLRIAQTSSEVKRQYKQNGPRLPERQLKQLQRGRELEERAARLREAEKSRQVAKKKREERERKEKAARKQMGVGLATQLVGYSHTQAQLKNGMEAFLGLKRSQDEEQRRRRDLELAKKLEAIEQTVEKESWDDDDTNDIHDAHDTHHHHADVIDAPLHKTTPPEQFVDADLDDDALLEAHDLLESDLAPIPIVSTPTTTRDIAAAADFTRLHGPINRAIESILDKLPEPLIELLSQDISLKLPAWCPTPALLYKLNPIGLPPHRLRIKVGSVVSLLRDLHTNSQLSKSQHLRILRAENERLECLVLDGPLQGTKALLTRVPFAANYRNDGRYPFQRTQFPIRIATNYVSSSVPPDRPTSDFRLPSVLGHARTSTSSNKACIPVQNAGLPENHTPPFKLPGIPASKAPACQSASLSTVSLIDGWDDFLDSGTQIARELSDASAAPDQSPTEAFLPFPVAKDIPPISTQDLDFSMDDLDDAPIPPKSNINPTRTTSRPETTHSLMSHLSPAQRRSGTVFPRRLKPPHQLPAVPPLRREDISPSQRPPSICDRPPLFKRKTHTTPSTSTRQIKRPRAVTPRPITASKPSNLNNTLVSFSEFGISTQDAASFFADDDDLYSGSPPIVV